MICEKEIVGAVTRIYHITSAFYYMRLSSHVGFRLPQRHGPDSKHIYQFFFIDQQSANYLVHLLSLTINTQHWTAPKNRNIHFFISWLFVCYNLPSWNSWFCMGCLQDTQRKNILVLWPGFTTAVLDNQCSGLVHSKTKRNINFFISWLIVCCS